MDPGFEMQFNNRPLWRASDFGCHNVAIGVVCKKIVKRNADCAAQCGATSFAAPLPLPYTLSSLPSYYLLQSLLCWEPQRAQPIRLWVGTETCCGKSRHPSHHEM